MASSRRWASSEPPVVLFDGVCNFCSGVVRFVIARDPHARFRFAPLQSDFAVSVLRGLPGGTDSIALLEGDRVYRKSTGALRIARRLRFPWPLAYVLIVLPRPLRDWGYDVVARHRYQWCGRTDACMVPTPEMRPRFLPVDTPKPAQIR